MGSEVEGIIYGVRLSPDASRVAVQSVPADGGTVVRIFDIARQVYTRIDPRPCKNPVWTPDGQVIVALCETERGWAVVRRAVDFSAPAQIIWEGLEMGSVDADGQADPLAVGGWPSWAADGSRLYWLAAPGTILSVDFDGSGAAPVVSAPREEHAGVVPFSPFGTQYSMSADGERVLASPRQVGVGNLASNRRLNVILNWADELQRRLAAEH